MTYDDIIKAMSDAEIREAVKCCISSVCEDCPMEREVCRHVPIEVIALRLIDRQNAKLERLQKIRAELSKENESLNHCERILIFQLAEERENAVEEFAERSEKALAIKQIQHRKHWEEYLMRHRGTEAYSCHEQSVDNWLRGYGEALQDILSVNDNTLKEMTEKGGKEG